jgi:hypothetical protein
MTNRIPAHIIGAEAVEALHRAGYRIVPTVPSPAMRRAAAEAMATRKRKMGVQWFYVSNRDKAAIRWAAMLDVWVRDKEGLSNPPHLAPKPQPRWSWKLGRFFQIAVDWAYEAPNKHAK